MDIDTIQTLFIAFIVICMLCSIIYILVKAVPSGIHYVEYQKHCLQMTSCYNPFSFEAKYETASYSGISCILKSEYPCYVQAFWGVPIYELFKILNEELEVLKNALSTSVFTDTFSSKCISANKPFLLNAREEISIQFKPCLNADETALHQETSSMRVLYPFVVLMVLNNIHEIDASVVTAAAFAIHIPDEQLKIKPHLLGKYIKLFGHVGEVKKIFLSSPATSDESGHDLCLVCYQRPVSMVYLPCRHACLCSVCFESCENCPVCRSSCTHYFELQ